MRHTAKTNPEVFFATCARLIPRDVAITVEQTMPRGLDEDDLEILRAIKTAIPDANRRQPGDVMAYVLDAIRAHDAKMIEGHTENVSASDRKN